jgi:hypothetical protein
MKFIRREPALPSIQSRSYAFRLSLLLALAILSSSSVCGVAQTLTAKPQESNFTPTIDFALGVSGELTDTRTPMTRSSEASAFVTQQTQAIDASAVYLEPFISRSSPGLDTPSVLGIRGRRTTTPMPRVLFPIQMLPEKLLTLKGPSRPRGTN